MLTNPEESNFGEDIIIQLLLAAANSIIGPCFVLITVSWYANTNHGCIVRLLLWASSYPVLFSTISHLTAATSASHGIYYATYTGLAAVCIILSVYIIIYVDTLGLAMGLDGLRQKDRFRARERWQQPRGSLPVCLWRRLYLIVML